MQTRTDVRDQLVAAHAHALLAKLEERVATGQLTPEEALAYRTRLAKAQVLACTPGHVLATSPTTFTVKALGHAGNVYDVGKTCTCPDANPRAGKALRGWCKHRLAAFLTLAADKDLAALVTRMEGLPIPHLHVYACGHTQQEDCWDHACTQREDMRRECADCQDPDTPLTQSPTPLLPPLDFHRDEYEVSTQRNPPESVALSTCPEATASLNLKCKHHNVEVMVTLRSNLAGKQADQDILARLPDVLAALYEQLGITFIHSKE